MFEKIRETGEGLFEERRVKDEGVFEGVEEGMVEVDILVIWKREKRGIKLFPGVVFWWF